MVDLLVDEIISKEGPLCEFCRNSLEGEPLETLLGYATNLIESDEPEVSGCSLCGGLIGRNLGKMLKIALRKLSEIEFESIKAAVLLPVNLIEREDRIRAKYNPPGMRSVKLTLIKLLDELLRSILSKPVSEEATVTLLFDFRKRDVDLKIAPVFVFGRYRKLKRGISQSRRKCPDCGGRGCVNCGWKGRTAEGSVEGMIGKVMIEFFEAEDYLIHGAGREDVDARMLGEGRPFVMEIINPKRRSVNLGELEREINFRWSGMIEVSGLRPSNREELRSLKESSPMTRKSYRALVEVEGEVSEEELKYLKEKLEGAIIKQRTPTRVLWRRSDLIRVKKVYEVNIKRISDNRFELYLVCDGGLYVKELISGDHGRTTPSVSEILGKKSFCTELDVVGVMIPTE